MGAMNLGKFER